jgi:hypothetical protein
MILPIVWYVIFATSFLWIGFIGAISFMEAWLKFRAPGVTMPIGLGIGKLVFGALNKLEWFFAIVLAITLLFVKSNIHSFAIVWYAIVLLILVLQSFWLLPVLDKRADAFINGQTLPPSALHWYFIVAELIKVIALFTAGICLIN